MFGELFDGAEEMGRLFRGQIDQYFFNPDIFPSSPIENFQCFYNGRGPHRLCIDNSIDILFQKGGEGFGKNSPVEEKIPNDLPFYADHLSQDISPPLGPIPKINGKGCKREPILQHISTDDDEVWVLGKGLLLLGVGSLKKTAAAARGDEEELFSTLTRLQLHHS